MGLILDSSIVIAAERRGHSVSELLQSLQARHNDAPLGLSVISVAELTHGAYRSRTESQTQQRLSFIDRLCADIPVYPLTAEIARAVGRTEGQLASRGVVLSFEDLAIGVTALHLGFAVATLNTRHFERIPGLTVVSA